MSENGFLCLSKISMVLLVRNAIFRFVCLKALVMYSVSLPEGYPFVSIVVVSYCCGGVAVV
jgi:hypothetical protein